MFEFIKQRIIKDLIAEIECIDATHLELVGHKIISGHLKKRMIHHGINKDYKPSSYTVDSFTDDSSIITEYSTDKSYFKDTSKKHEVIPFFEKIANDIEHAVNHFSPQKPEKIYLITSQTEPPSFRNDFNKTLIAQKYSDIVVIYDNRELAKFIYEQSKEYADFASFYKQFFPGFSQNFDNYEYYGKIPSFCHKHVSDGKSLNDIKVHLENNNICVICGLSGSGKTQMAIDYIHNEKNSYENYLWISGEDLKKDIPLSSIQRTRGGSPINIVGLFNSSKTILVIDNLNRVIIESDLVELTKGFSNGGKVVITSQISKKDNIYLAIPELSENVAYQIIGEKPEEASLQCKKVIKLCKCLPLVLSTIRNLVEEGVNREELYCEILKHPNDISDNSGKSIMGSILNKLEPGSLQALKKIANSGSTIHDSDFLSFYIGLINRSNLQRLSILLPASIPGCLKIHDLVNAALKEESNTRVVSEALEEYIEKNNASMSPSVIRQIHFCYEVLYREYSSNANKKLNWLTYSLLQVEGNKKTAIQETLYNESIQENMELSAIRCIIDSKEAHSYIIDNKKEREKYYRECIDEYYNAKQKTEKEELKKEFLHHLGKTYRRCGLQKESLDCFLELLSMDQNMHAAYLQIAHLGSQFDSEKKYKYEGEKYLKKLLDFILEDYSSVPLRVSLASFARLRSYKNLHKEISSVSEQVEKIANIIAFSSFEGFGQFYEAFVAFTSMFGYHHSSICIKLLENIPELLTISPFNLDESSWLNACEGLTNIAISASREGKQNLANKIFNTTVLFADKIFDNELLTSYQGRAIAKTYINNNMPDKALSAINKVTNDPHDHWLIYRKAEAQLKIKDVEAYNSATYALELAKNDSFAIGIISIYHDLLSKCAELIGNEAEAISHAEFAFNKCTDIKYKLDLDKRLKELYRK